MSFSQHTRRRLLVFRHRRRALLSLCIFIALFAVSLCAEFVANDRPLLLSYKGDLYTPLFCDYPETTFDGPFPGPADYHDPVLARRIAAHGWMLWPPVRYSFATIDRMEQTPFPAPPSALHPLGTDDSGRDVLACLLYGFRLSVVFGLALTVISAGVGIWAGAMLGYHGGWVDLAGQRFMEIWGGLPVTYLLIILASIMETSFLMLLGTMLLFSWMGLTDTVRAEFLRVRRLPYITAARALGLPRKRVIFVHILPNALVATVAALPFVLSGSITSLTSLDFLGFGLPAGYPSLGELVSQGRSNLHAPWIGCSAFGILSGTLILLVFIGEGIRDALDPSAEAPDEATPR